MEEFIRKIEDLGWSVVEFDDGLAISQYSPAGEDFLFEISTKTSITKAIQEIEEYSKNFDEEEHVEMWVEAKYHGSGNREAIPSIRELVYDAEAIHNMLRELADYLNKEYKEV